ncbi:hypothetical protein [Acinetobacter sp. YH12201]|uniref:hypothetical protein n=1 Tax=Acinetobacter sp. YH12201 TaxID=2601140 RepID=UPI001C55358B|nr:hypothetical protein [Acinetobacter sp. YH12201]
MSPNLGVSILRESRKTIPLLNFEQAHLHVTAREYHLRSTNFQERNFTQSPFLVVGSGFPLSVSVQEFLYR